MADVFSQFTIDQVLDGLQGELSAREIGVALAALIYLRWADFQEAEQEAIAAFEDTDYEPVLPAMMHWRNWHALSPYELEDLFAHRLPDALKWLGNARHNPLATYLHHVAPVVEQQLGRLSGRVLGDLIGWLADQPFETPGDRRDLLNTFDAVLEKTNDKYAGDYRTPKAVIQLLVALAAPRAGERIYDPCFGSAGLLTAAHDAVLNQEKDLIFRNVLSPQIFGVERHSPTFVIGLTRLALAGIDYPHIELGNSLERMPSDHSSQDEFDVVLANPPWGMRVDPIGLDFFPVRTTDATGLFIQHALSQLKPGGRAVMVVPQGFLFKKGAEQTLRQMLIEKYTVEAVVALPDDAFKPYASVRASILVLRRDGPTSEVRMADGSFVFNLPRHSDEEASLIQPFIQAFVNRAWHPEDDLLSWVVSAESLAEIDWDLTPRRRDQSGLLAVLDSLRSEVEVLPLKTCCHIFAGRSIKSSQLVSQPEENAIPYIRIGDVQHGQATKGSSWVSPKAKSSVDVKWKLRTGDVLLSKSGTIGKVGVVRNGAVGAIAANGLYVLRPEQDRLDPHFLLAYLDSKECRSWLGDNARGAVIKHLSIRVLEDLSVPLPSLQLQQHVAREHRDHNVDALDFLTQLLTEGEKDPIVAWMDQVSQGLLTNTIGDALNLSLLDHLTQDVHSACHEALHGSGEANPLMAWISFFSEAVSGLQGAENIPLGSGLLSVIQESRRKFQDAITRIKGYLPNEAKARNLTQFFIDRLNSAGSKLFDDIKLDIATDIHSIQIGKEEEIPLQVRNQGALPLRDLVITTKPDWGQHTFAYLAENTTANCVLSGISPNIPGVFSFTVRWEASRLDGLRVNGTQEIALNVIQTGGQMADNKPDLGGSPYICGDPVRPERNEVFFGREELLEGIRRQIIQSGNVVLLEGNRRSGKSSILWHLEGINAVPGWLGVYCSLQGAKGSNEGVGVPSVEIFREIATSIAKSLHAVGGETPLPDGTVQPPGKRLGFVRACRKGISEESSFADLREYVEVVLEKLSEHDLGLLLMLDEFDKLQEGIDSGVTSPQIPENIRYLVQTYPRFSTILTGSRRLKRLREEYWSALYGLGTRFGVTSLPEAPARLLITEPVKGHLAYTREAVNRAVYLTAGHPYLLQCLCNRIFDMATQMKTRSVSLDLVNQASGALVADNEHFASLWDYAGSNRRRFILSLCHKEATGSNPLRLGVIQEHLLHYGIEVDDEALIADLEFLRELELIELVGETNGGHYVLSIPLMGIWIEKQQDFAVVLSKARSETEDLHE